MPKLTVAKIKCLQKPGRYADGGTLYLVVAPGGSKHFVQRVTIARKRADIGLGGWPVVTLQAARDAALDNRRMVRDGLDPRIERRKAKAEALRAAAIPTFAEAVTDTYEAMRPDWKSEAHAQGWLRSLEVHAFPILGRLRVDSIATADVLNVLNPIWNTKQETARRVRSRIRTVFARCMTQGHVRRNVAGEALDGGLTKPRKVKRHFRALPFENVAEALDTIAASRACDAAKLALRFVILTTSRTGEVLGATWDEIDLDTKTWTIPGERMKAGREHLVPLSSAALKVLHTVMPLSGGDGIVFPSPRKPGSPLSNMALTKLLRDTGLAKVATVHGFRSTFRNWCEATGKDDHAAESALAHTVQGVRGAYLRTTVVEKRIRLMESWAGYCAQETASVVVLRRAQ